MNNHPATRFGSHAQRILLWLLPALVLAVAVLAFSSPAHADSGGWPTRPPTETPKPTSTATFIPPPPPSATLPYIFPPPGAQATVAPKGITSQPTELVPLSDEQLLATLQATPAQASESNSSPSFWVYAILGILLAAGLAALIAWIIMRFFVRRQP